MPLVLLAMLACSDIGLSDRTQRPEIELIVPVEGGRFDPTAPVPVCARIRAAVPLDDLDLVLSTDAGGVLATEGFSACSGGDLGIAVTLQDQPQILALTVTDPAGRNATARVAVTPVANSAPACAVITPAQGSARAQDLPVPVVLDVADPDGGPLHVQLDSTVDGPLAHAQLGAPGRVELSVLLSAGPHELIATITDPRGETGFCAVSVTAVACQDGDADGVDVCDGDCDDHDATTWPGAPELADGRDNDCDGLVDEGTILADDDGDGFSELDGDCDDDDLTVHPGAVELPDDGVDQDCDGHDAVTCFVDQDLDGWGGANTAVRPEGDCAAPGFSALGGDCDDADPTVHPGAAELPADGVDQDCDGLDPAGCFQDLDGDGYGSAVVLPPGDDDCDDPGESSLSSDCDDTDLTVHPGAVELPDDGVDQDCDGADTVTCYLDADGDGYGEATVVLALDGSCDAAEGEAAVDGDCDDEDAGRHPGLAEIPDDGIDQDCSGADTVTCYRDQDGDGFGGAELLSADGTCDPARAEAAVGGDCADADPGRFPGNPEIPGDGIDQDCSGADTTLCYADADGDGWGHGTALPVEGSCSPTQATQAGDCDDTDAGRHPGLAEIPDDGVDQDCSGADTITCYRDLDGDGFGGTEVLATDGICDPARNEVAVGGDCADTNPGRFPGNPEIPGDGIDQDCSGDDTVLCYLDADDDGWGVGGPLPTEGGCGAQLATLPGDCADTDPGRFPGNPEVLDDGIDQDCSGADTITCYQDLDLDGWGSDLVRLATDGICAPARLEAPDTGDCDDADPTVNPGAPDPTRDGVDQDCDGLDGVDADGDGWVLEEDCDDTDPAVNPGAVEVLDGVDQNCDGLCDEGWILPGDLVITEIMADPDGGDNHGEWFEIFNTTGHDITLCGGWTFEDDGIDAWTVDQVVTVPAGGYLVAGASDNVSQNGGVLVDLAYVQNQLYLANSPDELRLVFDGETIDHVAWGNGFVTSGRSRELDPGAYDAELNDALANWCLASVVWPGSAGDRGSPGQPNPPCP